MDEVEACGWSPAAWVSGDLRVVAFADRGRGLVTQRSLPAGTLLATEYPLASSLDPPPSLCSFCASPLSASPLLPCPSRCTELRVCSPACWAKAKDFHAFECGIDPDILGEPYGSRRVGLRLFLGTPPHLRYLWSTTPSLDLVESQLPSVLSDRKAYFSLAAALATHEKDRACLHFAEMDEAVSLLANLLCASGESDVGPDETKRQLQRAILVKMTNAFCIYHRSVSDKPNSEKLVLEDDIGTGLYPAMDLLNHSCDPNTSRLFEGTRMFLKLSRAVEAGEEITTSYGTNPRTQTTRQRRNRLKSWRFDCSCPDCCGSSSFLLREAAFWGWACPAGCPGPAISQGHTQAIAKAYNLIRRHKWHLQSLNKPLSVRCSTCKAKGVLSAQHLRSIVSVLAGLRGETTYPSSASSAVQSLHSDNQLRLLSNWVEERSRARRRQFLDQTGLDALLAVHANLSRLSGTVEEVESEAVEDAIAAARAIAAFPVRCEAANTALANLRSDAAKAMAALYGPNSPELTALHALFH